MNVDDFLRISIYNNDFNSVKLALICGADVNNKIFFPGKKEKVTLVKYCKLEGYKDIKQLLIEYGASSGIFG